MSNEDGYHNDIYNDDDNDDDADNDDGIDRVKKSGYSTESFRSLIWSLYSRFVIIL
jgi:hypothetical protein